MKHTLDPNASVRYCRPMSRASLSLVFALSCLSGCTEDAGTPDASSDAAVLDGGSDGGADAGDAGTGDAGTSDAGTSDAGTSDAGGAAADAAAVDAGSDASGPDAGGACHAHDFGAPAIPIRMVPSLPAMTGGTITPGSYDAIDAQTTGALGGTYRASWIFEDASTLAQIQQITLAGPGAVVPRVFSWSTSGTALMRSETCPGAETFTQTYRVRSEGGETLLDVRQATLMFTFRRR